MNWWPLLNWHPYRCDRPNVETHTYTQFWANQNRTKPKKIILWKICSANFCTDFWIVGHIKIRIENVLTHVWKPIWTTTFARPRNHSSSVGQYMLFFLSSFVFLFLERVTARISPHSMGNFHFIRQYTRANGKINGYEFQNAFAMRSLIRSLRKFFVFFYVVVLNCRWSLMPTKTEGENRIEMNIFGFLLLLLEYKKNGCWC